MDIIFIAIQLAIICLSPWVLNNLLRHKPIGNILSPVLVAYLLGIIISLTDIIPINEQLTEKLRDATILIAIPLLLFSTNLKAWFGKASSSIISFAFCIISALIASTIFALIFNNVIPEVWKNAGMLVGVFTGGTANLYAVGVAVDGGEEILVQNTVEMVLGGLYLIALTSFIPKLYSRFLKPYEYSEQEKKEINISPKLLWKDVAIAVALAIFCAVTALVSCYLFFANITNTTYIIVVISALGVILSFFKPIRGLRGAYETGDYLLLVFCVAIGLSFDLDHLIESGLPLLLFTTGVMLTTIVIHLILSKLANVDRDTTIITSTAAVYGPPFIGQIASVLKNREIIFTGISTSLVGYSVGNFLGISLSNILQAFLQNG